MSRFAATFRKEAKTERHANRLIRSDQEGRATHYISVARRTDDQTGRLRGASRLSRQDWHFRHLGAASRSAGECRQRPSASTAQIFPSFCQFVCFDEFRMVIVPSLITANKLSLTFGVTEVLPYQANTLKVL